MKRIITLLLLVLVLVGSATAQQNLPEHARIVAGIWDATDPAPISGDPITHVTNLLRRKQLAEMRLWGALEELRQRDPEGFARTMAKYELYVAPMPD